MVHSRLAILYNNGNLMHSTYSYIQYNYDSSSHFLSQTKFGHEVLTPYQDSRVMYEELKNKLQLLANKENAEQSFKKFEEIAKTIER